MPVLLEERARITAKGQTTIPKAVRQALDVGAGDEVAFVVDESGVFLHKVDAETGDPVIDGFLNFLAGDMSRNSRNIATFPPELAARIAKLSEGVQVDFDEDIDGPVEL